MKAETYRKLGSEVEWLKEKKKESLDEYLLLVKQLQQLEEALLLSAKKLLKYEQRYYKAFSKYSEVHVQELITK